MKKIIGILIFFIFLISAISLPLNNNLNSSFKKNPQIIQRNLPRGANYWTIGSFIIDETGGGNGSWAWAVSQDWCKGSGTEIDPYTIENLTIDAKWETTNCIYIMNSRDHFKIKNCTLYHTQSNSAIYLKNVTNGFLINNNISNCVGSGIGIRNSSYLDIRDNMIDNCSWLLSSSDYDFNYNTIFNNTSVNSKGISIYRGHNNNISYNFINNYSMGGITMNTATFDNIIEYNDLINATTPCDGIADWTVVGNNTYYRNTIINCEIGIAIVSQFSNFSSNYIFNCTNEGFWINGNNHTIYNNTIVGNKDGILIYKSSNIIKDNLILNNTENGIIILGGDYNEIFQNRIENNTQKGLYIRNPGFFNLIYNNSFIANGEHAVINGIASGNSFNNSVIGNFWDDYGDKGYKDENDDGIGDTPYRVWCFDNQAYDFKPQWYDGPNITVSSPYEGQVFGNNSVAPNFTISTHDPNLSSLWYTIDQQVVKHNISDNSSIDLATWTLLNDGNVSINFFGNDTFGNINNISIRVLKDTNPPNLTIHTPYTNQTCGKSAPNYNISIYDLSLDSIWYTINGTGVNISISSLTGIINQSYWETIWNSISHNDTITIIFYANDSLNRISYKVIYLFKYDPTTDSGKDDKNNDNKPIEITPYLLIISILSILGLTVIILIIRKRKQFS